MQYKSLVSFLTIAVASLSAVAAKADPTVLGVSLFANGGAVSATAPDSITIGNGSVWVEYGNGVDSTGVIPGDSTIVQYSLSGAVQQTYSIAGSVDGLKINPTNGIVWALQNQDANATLSLINPTSHTVTGPLSYAAPPYAYGSNPPPPPASPPYNNGRGYDDVAFLNGQVYLSYTNPVNPTDSVLQLLDNGNNPTGTLTTTSILTAQQTGIAAPDIDSLKSTPNGELVLTSEGDGPGTGNPVGTFTLIKNPGSVNQTVTNIPVTDGSGDASSALDDVLFPDATSGTLYVADTSGDSVFAIRLTGLDPNTPIISIGGFNEVATVDPSTGVVELPLLTGIDAHGLDFVPYAVPEPSTWAMMLIGFAGLGFAGYRKARKAASTKAS